MLLQISTGLNESLDYSMEKKVSYNQSKIQRGDCKRLAISNVPLWLNKQTLFYMVLKQMLWFVPSRHFSKNKLSY